MKNISRVFSVLALATTVLALGASALFAETDYLALKELDNIKKGLTSLKDPKLDTISEGTLAGGVTIDGLLIKDGAVVGAADSIDPADLAAGTLPSDVVYSNATGTITVSNVTVNGTVTGGDFTNAIGTITTSNLVANGTLGVAGATTLSGTTAFGDATTTANGNGAVVAAYASVIEQGTPLLHRSIITITNTANPDVLADGEDGEGIKIYDFPEGIISIHSVVAAGLVVTNEGNFEASDNDHYYIGIGTAEAVSGDNDLTTTEANLIAKITLDTAAGATTSHTNDAFLATTVIVDGSTTACDMWLNTSIEASDGSDTNTIGFTTGQVSVVWSLGGDY